MRGSLLDFAPAGLAARELDEGAFGFIMGVYI
jgi:hypothetical protein